MLAPPNHYFKTFLWRGKKVFGLLAILISAPESPPAGTGSHYGALSVGRPVDVTKWSCAVCSFSGLSVLTYGVSVSHLLSSC